MRERTVNIYSYWISRFIRFCDGKLDLRKEKVESFIHQIKSPSTARVAYSALKYIARILDREDELKGIILPSIDHKVPDFLTEEEVIKLIDSISNFRDRCLIALMYDCGLRVGEVLSINIEDINLEDKTVLIKSREKDRTPHVLPLSDKTVDIIKSYLDVCGKKEGALFSSSNGRLSYAQAYYIVRRWGELILNRRVHPHMLRHSSAIMLRKRGVDMDMIRDFLGHKTDAVTRIYARLIPSELKKLPQRL